MDYCRIVTETPLLVSLQLKGGTKTEILPPSGALGMSDEALSDEGTWQVVPSRSSCTQIKKCNIFPVQNTREVEIRDSSQ